MKTLERIILTLGILDSVSYIIAIILLNIQGGLDVKLPRWVALWGVYGIVMPGLLVVTAIAIRNTWKKQDS